MGRKSFRKYAVILSWNLRKNLAVPLLLAVVLLAAVPVVFGIRELDRTASAVPLEMLAALTGVLLFTPLLAPESAVGIRDTVEAKYTPYSSVLALRAAAMAAAELILCVAFVLIMKGNGCDTNMAQALGTFAEALFLGALGFFGSAVSANTAVGYMLPAICYVLNFTGGRAMFKTFYLFSMQNGSYTEKWYLAAAAVILFAAGFLLRRKSGGSKD